jgi:uncharacterized protein YdaU (DUF1376 family)
MKRPWMPLYIGDYLGDTGHLTTTQHGAYLLLMMHYWRKGEIPDDDKQLCKITKMPLKIWIEYRPIIQDFFCDGWRHKRIDEEIAKMMKTSAARSAAGYKGGITSALGRMKLENASVSKHVSSQANARPGLTRAEARHNHSHSHNITYTSSVAAREALQNGEALLADQPQGTPGRRSPTELSAILEKRKKSTAGSDA